MSTARALVIAAGVSLVAAGCRRGTASEPTHSPSAAPPSTARSRVAHDFEQAFTIAAASVTPMVVQILSERMIEAPPITFLPFGDDPFEGSPFEELFPPSRDPSRGSRPPTLRRHEFRALGLGSGVLVRPDGYVVTNDHVVREADHLKVQLSDGRRLDATLVGTDRFTDLAVVKIDVTGLPAVAFANSDSLKIGQWVLAVGSPLSTDLINTVTAGIVSAIGRLSPTGESVQAYIQTDAAINPGNSGGALVDLDGRLVGVNAAIATRTGGFQGIGFAIPVNTVRRTVEELIAHGRVRHARLGIRYSAASPALIRALKLPPGAAEVAEVEEGSAADRAGIKPGDVIVEANGQELKNSLELSTLIENAKPGSKITLTLNRDAERRSVTVTLDAVPDGKAAEPRERTKGGRGDIAEELGFAYSDVTPALAAQFGLSRSVEGVLITDVDPGSEAFREANLRPGQVITEVARKKLKDARDFELIYRGIEPGSSFLVRVLLPDGHSTMLTALTKPRR